MMQLVRLDAGFVNVTTNAPQSSAYDPVGASDDDRQAFGDVPLMQALGVASLPYPPDASGQAEGVLLEGVAGLPGVVVGAWDTRTFSLFGNLSPGDTVLHSTGPNRSAQVLCKEEKRQAMLATTTPGGELLLVVADGKKERVQVLGLGALVEVGKDEIKLEAGGNGITIGKGGIHIRGPVTLGGMVPPPGAQMCMAVASPAFWAALNSVPSVVSAAASGPCTPILLAGGAL